MSHRRCKCQKTGFHMPFRAETLVYEPVPRLHSHSDRSVSVAMTAISASHRFSVFLSLLYQVIVLAGGLVKRVNTVVVTFHAFLESSSRAPEIITGGVQFIRHIVYDIVQQTGPVYNMFRQR
ncbi:hypothetical protein J6590_093248 [Homalodisca vitripennis]|nr:hypothetical protein J6590_093248 [Homalodisca vitripennis]